MGKNDLVIQTIFTKKKDHFQLIWEWSFFGKSKEVQIG